MGSSVASDKSTAMRFRARFRRAASCRICCIAFAKIAITSSYDLCDGHTLKHQHRAIVTAEHSLTPEILESNGVRLNLRAREVVCDGIPVDLTAIEFGILECLVRSAGAVVSRDELARFLSHQQINPFEDSLDAHVSQLRRKLERGRRLIQTIPGAGYLFAAEDEHSASGYQLA